VNEMRKIVYEAVVPEQKKRQKAELAVVVGADAEDVPSSIVAVLVDVVGGSWMGRRGKS
jgi:hypothetical protein